MDWTPIITVAAIIIMALIVRQRMAGVFMDRGLDRESFTLAGGAGNSLSGWTMHLYQNNHTPAVGDLIGAYTEATFSGYAAVALNTWTPGAIAGNTQPNVSNQASFTQTTSPTDNTIYGYYLTDSTGALAAAELFTGGPYAMNAPGTILRVTVTENLTRV